MFPLLQQIFLPFRSASVAGFAIAAETKARKSTEAVPSGETYLRIQPSNKLGPTCAGMTTLPRLRLSRSEGVDNGNAARLPIAAARPSKLARRFMYDLGALFLQIAILSTSSSVISSPVRS